MKYVITGSTSMIGVALINEILKDSDAFVYAVIRANTNRMDRLPKDSRLKTIGCDSDSYEKLPELINDKCDVFYHFAWNGTGDDRNKSAFTQVDNVKSTIQTLLTAKKLGCSKYIGAGSQAEFGTLNQDIWKPSSPCNPVQQYGIAKYAAGRYVLEMSKDLDIVSYWVRIFSVFGKNDGKNTLIQQLINCAANNIPLPLSPCEQKWDYLYEKDAGRAFYLLGKNGPKESKLYCLGSGESKPLKEYVLKLIEMVNPSYEPMFGKVAPKNSILNIKADISYLKDDVNWAPAYSFEEALAEIIAERK